MAKDYSQVNFRIPTKLKEEVEKAAIQNERSITSELVARLEHSFHEDQRSNDETLLDAYEKLVETLLVNVMTNLEEDGVEPTRIRAAVKKASKHMDAENNVK